MGTVEVMKSELDLFSKIQFQKSIDHHEFSQINPTNSIGESNDIEFLIPGTEKEYIDLQNIHLTITGKLVKQDGSAYTAEQDGRNSLIPYGLFTIWNQIAIYLNQTLISQASNTIFSLLFCISTIFSIQKYNIFKPIRILWNI